MATVDMAARERIASEILGTAVRDGETMRCRFEQYHSKGGGARDVRVCLTDDGGKLPTFHCFHTSCAEAWRPLNRELRRRIWFAEHRRRPDRGSTWDDGSRIPAEPKPEAPRPKPYDEGALRKLLIPGVSPDRKWFADRSAMGPAGVTAEGFLEALFLPGERVLVFDQFASQGQFIHWIGRGSYRLGRRPDVAAVPSPAGLPKGGAEGIWYLCQPVTGQWYPNPRNPRADGTLNLSRRSMEAVTAWRYLVLESDAAPEWLWLNFLARLPMPIAAIYTSGGKSIHALIRVEAASKTEWDGVKRALVGMLSTFGGDPGALSAVRLTRLPGCLRGNRKQELLYLNPSASSRAGAIIDF